MTDNHILLYRLAELMFEHEQHILPVDLLFDDVRIGNFAKSIQIDSPYQQMLLEGILTESVRDEKLFVSFTVEGYFQFVLGEVIYHRTEGLGAEAFKQIVEENKLNGAKEGVEQCLIRDVQKGDLNRLICLIDEGGKALDASTYPLVQAFSITEGHPKTSQEKEEASKYQIGRVMEVLLADYTDNDIKVLGEAIGVLESSQLNLKVSTIYKEINKRIEPKTIKHANLYVKSIKYIPVEERLFKLDELNRLEITTEEEESGMFYSSFGEQYEFIASYDNAIDSYEKSLAIYLKLHGDNHPLIGKVYNSLGSVLNDKGDYDKAVYFYEKSLGIFLQMHSVNQLELEETHNNFGLALGNKGNYVKSIEHYEKALSISIMVNGYQHPSTAGCFMGLGWINRLIGNYDKAIEYNEMALLIYSQVYGDKHELTGSCHNNLGSIYCHIFDFGKALIHYEKSHIIMLKIHGDEHTSTAASYVGLGSVSKNLGDLDAAINYLTKALSIFIKLLGDQHSSTGTTYFHLALVHVNKGKFDRALEYYEKAYQIFIKVLGEDHNHTKLVEKKIRELNDL
jgi:tetratricopeptide (TPR) repeat protein